MNYYWFLYNLIDESIYGAPYLGPASEWTNIPKGCGVIGPFDELTANEIVKDAYIHPNYYLVQTDKIIARPNILDLQLADAKQAKISEVTQAYQAQLNSTFTSSATGTPLVYNFSPESQNLWKELSDAILAGYIPDTMFPMSITPANGTNASHTKLQLQQIFGEITARKLSLYGKLQGMVTANGSIMKAGTVDDVSAIHW